MNIDERDATTAGEYEIGPGRFWAILGGEANKGAAEIEVLGNSGPYARKKLRKSGRQRRGAKIKRGCAIVDDDVQIPRPTTIASGCMDAFVTVGHNEFENEGVDMREGCAEIKIGSQIVAIRLRLV